MKVFTEALPANQATITCYVQDNSPEMLNITTRPAMLIFPGGGYYMCSDREAEPIAVAYLNQGYNAFVVRYTVGRDATFAQALDDAKAAMTYLHKNAETLGIDTQRIAAVGFSAGGHLAACLGTVNKEQRPNALILGYPCILASSGAMLGKALPGADEAVDAQTPPTFLFSTQGDNVVPIENSLQFIAALAKAGVPFEEHIFLTGEHGLSLASSHTCSGKADAIDADVAQWLAMSVRFLKHIWGDFPVQGTRAEFTLHKDVLDLPMRKLLENPQAEALINEALPQFAAQKNVMLGLSLRRLSAFAQGTIPEETFTALGEKLRPLFA